MLNLTKNKFIAGRGNYHSFLSKDKVVKKKSVPATTTKNNINASSACEKPSGFFSQKNQVSFGNNATKVAKKASKQLPKWIDDIILNKKFNKLADYADKAPGIMEIISAVAIVCTLRPGAIAITPGAEKRDKQYAIARSWATATIDVALGILLLKPIASAYKKLEKGINKALKGDFGGLNLKTAQRVMDGKYKHLIEPASKKANSFGINFGAKILTTPLRAVITVACIPVIMKAIFPNKKTKQKTKAPQMTSPIRFQSNRLNLNKNVFKEFQMKEAHYENNK